MVKTLIDTGPIISLLNRRDRYHQECAALFRELNCPFYTTLPVITEAMYFLGECGGVTAQSSLWKLVLRGDFVLHHPSIKELLRMSELMEKYHDHPMDFADASLVTLAEGGHLNRVFTLDYNDFTTYRLPQNSKFTIIGPRS